MQLENNTGDSGGKSASKEVHVPLSLAGDLGLSTGSLFKYTDTQSHSRQESDTRCDILKPFSLPLPPLVHGAL